MIAPPRRVVVTGVGAATSVGRDVETVWKNIVDGRSGVAFIEQFDSSPFPVRIGGEVDLDAMLLDSRSQIPAGSRAAQFGLWSLDRAWEDAGLDVAGIPLSRAGVCVGASTFPEIEENIAEPERMLSGDGYDFEYYVELCRKRPELLAQRDIGSISTVLGQRVGIEGPSMTIQTACASATQAVGEAMGLIRSGHADVMVTGGADSMMTVLCLAGFTLVGVLSKRNDEPTRASRPFELNRDGFVLGEGAGILILEELSHALERGAPIIGELIGYGSSSDGYRFTDVHPEGRGAIASMSQAVGDAGIEPGQVDYINAHGTATILNDPVETSAIKQVFGASAYDLAISSTKSQLGHLVCAAGGIELIVTLLALRDSIVPPTINLERPDPKCDLDYVPLESRRAELNIALSNSFGFGGQNGSIVARRWTGT